MTFDQIVEQVILYTNRPDLTYESAGGDGQIPQIVLSTCTEVHTSDMFYKDIVESDVLFDTPAYLQNLDTTSLTRFRALSYFRKWDIAEGTMDSAGNMALSYGAFGNNYNPPALSPSTIIDPVTGAVISSSQQYRSLDIVDTKSMFDDYGLVKQDIIYAAGSLLRIKSSTLLSVGKIGYFSYPSMDISDNGTHWSDWIADSYPWAIIWSAVARVFSVTGNLDDARNLLRPANPRTGDPGGEATRAVAAIATGNIELGGR